jgi:hypothetical protein
MNPHKLQRRTAGCSSGCFARNVRRAVVFLTTVRPATEMLMDDRFGDATAQLLAICCASAFGHAERQDCFVCLQPWTAERRPESIGCAEFVERPDAKPMHSLMFGICWDCCWDRPAVLAALKRDFGDFAEFSNTPGTA